MVKDSNSERVFTTSTGEEARRRIVEVVHDHPKRITKPRVKRGTTITPAKLRKSPVVHNRGVEREVWVTAMRLAHGDASRIEVRSPREVVVTNGG